MIALALVALALPAIGHNREAMVSAIWSTGLPEAIPAATANAPWRWSARATRLDITVSGMDFRSRAYLLSPEIQSGFAAIVHQGHADDLGHGVGETIQALLGTGAVVVVMHMPLYGWNTDRGAVTDAGKLVTLRSHGAILWKLGMSGLRLFLEPVVQVVNYLSAMPGIHTIGMVGISGGAWTTHLIAAVDDRVSVSIAVAGSDPDRLSGDSEQNFRPFFDRFPWRVVYAMATTGGRTHIMVTNEHDPCCFSTANPDMSVQGFRHVVDDSHREHRISDDVIRSVIVPHFSLPTR